MDWDHHGKKAGNLKEGLDGQRVRPCVRPGRVQPVEHAGAHDELLWTPSSAALLRFTHS